MEGTGVLGADTSVLSYDEDVGCSDDEFGMRKGERGKEGLVGRWRKRIAIMPQEWTMRDRHCGCCDML